MDSSDLGSLLKLVAPVVGGFAGGASGSGFQQGFLHGQSIAQQEKDQKEQEAQHKNAQGADYLTRIADHAQSFDDPVALDQFLTIAQQAGEQAGYVKPGQLKGQITVSPNKLAEKKLKELNDQLASYEQHGYNLDDLAASGAVLELKDGQQLPFASAMNLTQKRPLSAGGQPIAKPQKIDTSQSTEEERFVQKWAKDRGKKFSDLTGDEELQARTAFRNAGRGPAGSMDERAAGLLSDIAGANAKGDTATATAKQAEYNRLIKAKTDLNQAGRNPELDQVTLALKQLQLQNEKTKSKPIDIVPGSREYKVAEDLAFGKLTMPQFRSLYSYSRDVNAKTSIYEKASEINPNFNPAQFEMGYKFASNPKTQNQVASINNVLSGVPDLLKVSDAATRSGVTLLNQLVVPGGIMIGGKRYSNFKTAQIAFADELSGALGYGSATDMSREMGFNMTNPALSPENFKSAIQEIVVPFVQRKKASLIGQMGPYGQTDQSSTTPPGKKVGRFEIVSVK